MGCHLCKGGKLTMKQKDIKRKKKRDVLKELLKKQLGKLQPKPQKGPASQSKVSA